jgi:ribosomal protein S27E
MFSLKLKQPKKAGEERKVKCPRCSSRSTIYDRAANALRYIFCMNCRMVFEK